MGSGQEYIRLWIWYMSVMDPPAGLGDLEQLLPHPIRIGVN